MARSTLSRLVQRTRHLGQIACVPHGSYRRSTTMHPAFQECIRRLYLLPVRLSMTAIHEHADMRQVAERLAKDTGTTVKRPSYDQVRRAVHRLTSEPELVAMREGAKALPRMRESPHSFALSIPAPALLTQVDEHSLELYVVTPDGIAVTQRVHAAVLVCVKTAAILGAILSLGPLKEVYYDRRDVSVLSLFVEGVYVGEAYCPQLMGGRVSEWEARAMRKHDEMQARIARERGQQARARIQSEAGRARKRRAAAIRQAEHRRQWDRQREDIHPAEVLERLTSLESTKPARPKLPPAVPDADPDRPVRVLPVRPLREEPWP